MLDIIVNYRLISADQPNAMQNIAARQLALNQSKEKFDLISEEVSLKCLRVLNILLIHFYLL